MNNEQMQKIAKEFQGKKRLSPLKAIKSYCRFCCSASDLLSWKCCSFKSCLLYPYHLGKGNRVSKSKHISEEGFSEKQSNLKLNSGEQNEV